MIYSLLVIYFHYFHYSIVLYLAFEIPINYTYLKMPIHVFLILNITFLFSTLIKLLWKLFTGLNQIYTVWYVLFNYISNVKRDFFRFFNCFINISIKNVRSYPHDAFVITFMEDNYLKCAPNKSLVHYTLIVPNVPFSIKFQFKRETSRSWYNK